jgi:hypothetical protein
VVLKNGRDFSLKSAKWKKVVGENTNNGEFPVET